MQNLELCLFCFNIGEPVMYGLPTVLNPILFIPFLLCPAVMSSVAYLVTDLGWVSLSNTKCNLGNATGLIWILFDRI